MACHGSFETAYQTLVYRKASRFAYRKPPSSSRADEYLGSDQMFGDSHPECYHTLLPLFLPCNNNCVVGPNEKQLPRMSRNLLGWDSGAGLPPILASGLVFALIGPKYAGKKAKKLRESLKIFQNHT